MSYSSSVSTQNPTGSNSRLDFPHMYYGALESILDNKVTSVPI